MLVRVSCVVARMLLVRVYCVVARMLLVRVLLGCCCGVCYGIAK